MEQEKDIIYQELKESWEDDDKFRQRALDEFIAENNKCDYPMGKFVDIVVGVCRVYQRATERILGRIEARAAINTARLRRIEEHLNIKEKTPTTASKPAPERGA